MPHNHPLVVKLVEQARRRCLAVVYYRKCVTSAQLPARLVEPYSFADGKQDLMIRVYQLEPEPGWRFFMSHKLDHVEGTATAFKPRRKISLPAGEVATEFEPSPDWDDGRKVYRDHVGDALCDGVLSEAELFDLEGVKQKYKLQAEDVRFVHASIYHRCLGTVLADGFVDADEVEQIRFLHKAMSSLGWCVGD